MNINCNCYFILPVNDKFKLDFANEYIPSPKDSKALEAETLSKPFPMIKLKNKEIIVKFLDMFFSSQHEFGKLILTLSKDFKNMSIKEFDKQLAIIIHELQVYISSYISYKKIFKVNVTLVKELFEHINSKDMELFSNNILIKTTFTTFFISVGVR